MAEEVEIKFRVAEVATLEAGLSELGFRQRTPRTHEMNTLYDAHGRLRRKGELLRIRKYGENWIVTHKAKAKSDRHKSRVETETEISDGEQLHRILLVLGYEPCFRYEKFRSEWDDGVGHVLVDETPIGNFAEIEGPPQWIDTVAAKLGISRADYIIDNYAELFEQWRRSTGSLAQEMTFAALRK